MEWNINHLIGHTLEATDGKIGKIEDFYFEDIHWDIRYFIVDTGNWLLDHKVLIAPVALDGSPTEKGNLRVHLSMDKIKTSPNIDTHKPVSRWEETELYEHYGWGQYWGTGFYAGSSLSVGTPFPVLDQREDREANKMVDHSHDELHLRSTEGVKDYHLHALDGDIGHLTDFIFDDATWKITFLVIDTRNWLEGQHVLIPIQSLIKIDWESSKIYLNLSISDIKNEKHFHALEYQNENLLHPR